MIYYVYGYLRKDGTPYYIGKGKDKRVFAPHSVPVPPKERIIFYEKNLTNIGACAIERKLIRWYGRKDNNTGILRNLTDGGEGSDGWKASKETRKKISKILTGRKLSEKTKNKMSKSRKGMKRSEQVRKNISEGRKGIKFTDEHKENLRLALEKRERSPRSKTYIIDGVVVEDLKKFCSEIKCSYARMTQAAKYNRTYKGMVITIQENNK